MYGRFLFGWPQTPGYRPLSKEVAEIEPKLLSALKALIQLPAEDDNVFAPQTVWLSDGAIKKFEEFRRLVDNMKRGLDGRERQWCVKGETQCSAWLPSRPGEFHPEPLTDPDVTLSRHPARATARRLPPSIECRAPPVAS